MLLGETMLLKGQEMVVDLIVFDIPDFDIIININFLSHYGAKIYCKKKKV